MSLELDPSDPPLVGRSAETRVLRHALTDTTRRRPSVIQVVGAPGLGKTRLIAETCADAASRGMLVIHGSAEERGRGRLFAAVADPFAELLETASDGQRARLTGLTDDLAPLLHLGRSNGMAADDLGARALANLLRRVLTNLSVRQPVLVAVDDVHWADEGSIDVLAALSRRPPDAAVVVLLGFRPLPGLDALQAIRPGPLEGATRGMFHRLELSALTEPEIAELLPGESSAKRHTLFEVCGGNPFYLQALSGSTDELTHDALDRSVLPSAVRAALVSELAALEPTDRHVVDAAAVVGDPFDAGLVAAVADVDIDGVLASLDRSRTRHLCTTDATGRWRFRHPLLHRVAYDVQPTGDRLRSHQRAADALAIRGAPPAQRARHLLMSAKPGDLVAAELLLDAADQLAAQAPRQAANWYEGALAIAPEGGRRGAQTVRLARAQALASTGQLAEAREIVHDILAELPRTDSRRQAACALAARVEHLMGRNEESAALLLRELSDVSGCAPSAVTSLYLELATTRLLGGAFDDAREAAEMAQGLVDCAPERDHLLGAYAAGVIALTAAVGGDIDAALDQRRTAALGMDGLTDAELASVLESGVWLGWAEMFLELLPDARRHLERCLAIARRGAHHHLLPHLLIGHGSVLKTLGDLTGAAESYDEAAAAAARIESPELDTMTMAMQCRGATWLGDLERAEAIGLRAVQAASDRANWFASVAVAVLAQARVTAGRPDGCIAAIYDAGGGPDLPWFDPASRCDWWEVVARAALLCNDIEVAADAATRAVACAAPLRLASPRGYAGLAEAAVLLARSEYDEAAARAGEAMAAFAESGHQIERARAGLLCGLAHGEAGRRTEALAYVTDAEVVFAACRARHLQAQARGTLRRLGKRVARVPSARQASTGAAGPLAPLSAREREVAALVAQGHTNRQIAADLFLSEKTVESHLAHIFTKLEVSSRAAVAGLVSQSQPVS